MGNNDFFSWTFKWSFSSLTLLTLVGIDSSKMKPGSSWLQQSHTFSQLSYGHDQFSTFLMASHIWQGGFHRHPWVWAASPSKEKCFWNISRQKFDAWRWISDALTYLMITRTIEILSLHFLWAQIGSPPHRAVALQAPNKLQQSGMS